MRELTVFNTMTREKSVFQPVKEGEVSIYVCGVTPYNHPHIGNARPFVTWDTIRRYLSHVGYKVTYIQNFTDVDDKIINTSNGEGVAWNVISDRYIDAYYDVMDALHVRRADVYPRVSTHMEEIISMITTLIDNGYAYAVDGDVYYRVEKFEHYGKLSGRNLDDIVTDTRDLDGQDEKKHSYDFALWKKAAPEHIMHWPSPWSEGFPGWHMECSVMGEKYLGQEFDIHGGGMDLMFPHHECEIAQNVASRGTQGVHYWVHNNMITINGQKMGKSLGNFITLEQFFTGDHPKLDQPYSPMTIRFFILQAHYRSTVDFSNEALQASRKGLDRLMEGFATLGRLAGNEGGEITESYAEGLSERCYAALNDDLNSPIVISHLFDACRLINQVADKQTTITPDGLEALKRVFSLFAFDLLGLKPEADGNAQREESFGKAVDLLLDVRQQAKAAKDWATSDKIRDDLAALGFAVKDTKDGATWKLEK